MIKNNRLQRAEAFFGKNKAEAVEPPETGDRLARAENFFNKPAAKEIATEPTAAPVAAPTETPMAPPEGLSDEQKNRNAIIASRNLEAQGIPQESFLKRFGKNLASAPVDVAKGAAGIAGSMFGGKQVGETLQAGLLMKKNQSEQDEIYEIFRTQLDNIEAMDLPQEKKDEAKAILNRGLEEQAAAFEEGIEMPTGKQVLADLAEIGLDLATLGQGTAVKTGLKTMALQVGAAASGAYSETGEIKDGLTGAAVATAFNMIPFAGKATSEFRQSYAKKAQQKADDAVKEILQVQNKADFDKAANGLSEVDLTNTKTYEELVDATSETMQANFNAQTKYLEGVEGVVTPKTATTTVGKRKIDYMKEALEDMQTVYEKEGDIAGLARMDDLIEKYNATGLPFAEANLVAKEYGGQFKNASFTKAGDPKSSITAARHENVRKGVKDTFRNLLPDEKSKVLDAKASNLYETSDALTRVENQVFKLENRVAKRKLLDRLGKTIGSGLDTLTLGMTGGLVRAVIPSNAGNKVMNALSLQDAIQKNVKLIQKANNAKTDELFISRLGQIINQLPPALRQSVIKPATQNLEVIEPNQNQ